MCVCASVLFIPLLCVNASAYYCIFAETWSGRESMLVWYALYRVWIQMPKIICIHYKRTVRQSFHCSRYAHTRDGMNVCLCVNSRNANAYIGWAERMEFSGGDGSKLWQWLNRLPTFLPRPRNFRQCVLYAAMLGQRRRLRYIRGHHVLRRCRMYRWYEQKFT